MRFVLAAVRTPDETVPLYTMRRLASSGSDRTRRIDSPDRSTVIDQSSDCPRYFAYTAQSSGPVKAFDVVVRFQLSPAGVGPNVELGAAGAEAIGVGSVGDGRSAHAIAINTKTASRSRGSMFPPLTWIAQCPPRTGHSTPRTL